MEVAGADYFLTAGDDPAARARLFFRDRLRNVMGDELRRPSLIASDRHPLVLDVDGVIVRAWPAFVPREHGAKTYENQATGERVLATRGPVWMFAARGRESSPGGTTGHEQSIADVVHMAKLWLRRVDG